MITKIFNQITLFETGQGGGGGGLGGVGGSFARSNPLLQYPLYIPT